MHLYNLTLQRSNAVTCAAHGSFSSANEQEVVVSHGQAIELLRPDADGKLLSICHMECFGLVRSVAALRLPGANTDCIALGSDSGRLAIVHYVPERDQFERIHLETYGRGGCRRSVAGQYIAADPAGRAIMIAAIEKQRVVFTLDRDSSSLVSISSPIEAPRPGAITFALCALDVGKNNPLFACIELEYAAATQNDAGEPHKVLSFYEVDLAKSQVLKKSSEPIDPSSNLLIPVPGGAEGPGGVLVCAENKLAYIRAGGGGGEVVALIPRRNGMPVGQTLLITAHTLLRQGGNAGAQARLLIQSELGDVYVVSFSSSGNAAVSGVTATYYDTLPVAISLISLGPSPGGRLFVGGEFADHRLYQFVVPAAGRSEDVLNMVQCEAEGERFLLPHFEPRGLRNLVLLDSIESLAPVLDLHCADLAGEDSPQLYALCGRGPRSSLRTLRQGMGVAEMAVSDLPSSAYAVWTVKNTAKDEHHRYILVGLANEQCPTIVLSVGETVEMCTSVKFVTTAKTIAAGELGNDMMIQVHQTHVLLMCDSTSIY
jgi:splicing factor 3B subunit 3